MYCYVFQCLVLCDLLLLSLQARQTLNEIRGALIGVNQRQQWVIDVMTSVSRLEQALDRGRPHAVQVQASLNPAAMQPAGAGTGLGQPRPQPAGVQPRPQQPAVGYGGRAPQAPTRK